MRRKLQNHSNKGKGKEKRKSEEKERRRTEKKVTVALRLSFYNSYSGDRFAPKKLWNAN